MDGRIFGIVKQHVGRGTRLGLPLINLDVIPDVADGVYLALAEVEKKFWPALAFSGVPKTFGEHLDKIFELYILDFDRDLYGHEIKVKLLRRLNDVTKFSSADELKAKVAEYEEVARDFFKDYNSGN